MKKITFFTFIFLAVYSITALAQDPFEYYMQKDESWQPTIFELYIKQYAEINVDKDLMEPRDLRSVKFVLEEFSHTETESLDEAVNAIDEGKKVFFFIETYVWGGLNTGTVKSGSWQMDMPLCSGFYIYEQKCFENEGLNFHCGKKENAKKIVFFIMH